MDNTPRTAAELEASIPEDRKRVLIAAAGAEADRILKEAGYESSAPPDRGTVFQNMPRGRVIVGTHKPVVALAGPALARSLMFAQLTHSPESQIPALRSIKAKRGPSSAERRAAKIAAGKLKVENGRLVGAA